MGGRRGIVRRDVGVGIALGTGERQDLRTEDRGRAMHLAEMREGEL